MEINVNTVSLFMGIASLVIGIAALLASVIFFFAARQAEKSTTTILSDISNQTKNLERLNDNLLSTAIHHLAVSNTKLIEQLSPIGTHRINQKLVATDADLISRVIAIYFYTARSFYLATLFKQAIPLSEETKVSLVIADDVIEKAKDDFISINSEVDKLDQNILANHHLYPFVVDIKTYWYPVICNSKI